MRYSNEELLPLLRTNERYSDTQRKNCETKCVVIDEVSMIISKHVAQVEFFLRKIRRETSGLP